MMPKTRMDMFVQFSYFYHYYVQPSVRFTI